MIEKILKLLQTSSISDHDKFMVRTLLPVMKPAVVKRIFQALQSERDQISRLNEKQKRIELKYRVMVEKLVEMENEK